MSQDPNTPPPHPESNPYPPPPPLFNDPPPEPPPQYNAGPSPSSGGGQLPSKDERTWAMFAHLSGLIVGIIVGPASGGFLSILSFLGPMVIYLMKKDESTFIADQAKEAMNFMISVNIIVLVLLILTLTVILAILTIPGILCVSIGALVLVIIAAIAANDGKWYRYPFTVRLIK